MSDAFSIRNLVQVKIEMNDKVMEEFFDGHELIEVGILFSRIIHAPFDMEIELTDICDAFMIPSIP